MSADILTLSAIPTVYGGVQFRSRLEARWAAFFDLVKWRWSYEPIDLQGWIPDFILHGKAQITLVEIKPTYGVINSVASKVQRGRGGALSQCEILLLGLEAPAAAIHGPTMQQAEPIGWLWDDRQWADAHFFRCAKNDNDDHGWDFCHAHGSWHGRMTGLADGDAYLDFRDGELSRLWREAGNAVQWQPKKAS